MSSMQIHSTDTTDEPRCLVIVPVYNERDSIGRLIRHLHRSLPGFDVVVIDDGSTDDTAHQVPPGTAVVSLPFNLGIGGAMQSGYRYAAMHGYDIAVQCDGDGQHRPSEIIRLVGLLRQGEADLVVGSRFLGARTYRQTVVRTLGSAVLRGIIRLLTGLNITDCTSGFRAGNRKVIHAFAHWYPEDYPEPEVILLLHRAGFRIQELPVRMRQRRTGSSSIGLLKGVFYVIKVTTCLLLDMIREPWPVAKIEGAVDAYRAAEETPTEAGTVKLQAKVDKSVTAAFKQGKVAPDVSEDHPAGHWPKPAAAGRAATQ